MRATGEAADWSRFSRAISSHHFRARIINVFAPTSVWSPYDVGVSRVFENGTGFLSQSKYFLNY